MEDIIKNNFKVKLHNIIFNLGLTHRKHIDFVHELKNWRSFLVMLFQGYNADIFTYCL